MGERSARWLRVSTGKQDEGMQIPDVDRWETEHGYDVRKTYTISGASAFKGNTKFDSMWSQVIKDIINGVFTVLVVWKTDRIDRKLQTYEMIKEVVNAGGRVEFVTQPHLNDLSTMAGRVALNIQSEIAHEESKVKQDRAHMTRHVIRSNGGITSRPPFGYAVEGPRHGKYFVIVESLEETVKTIFAKCITGDSLITIAKWLDAEGVPTARGGKWSNTALKNIINNRAYMGYITDNDGKTIGKCPVIIDAATWNTANKTLSARPNHGPILTENRALCTGSLFCPKCSSPMYRISCKTGPVLKDGSRAREYFYRCAGRGAQRKGCGNMVWLNAVDALVNKAMSTDNAPVIIRKFVPGHNHADEIADVDYRISQLSPEGLTRAEYLAKQNELWDEKEVLENMPDVPDDWESVDTGETYASKWNAADEAGKRDILKETRIYAGKNERGEAYVIIEVIAANGLRKLMMTGNPGRTGKEFN